MPAIDDTPVITGPRLRQAIARQRSRNARVLSWVRAVGAVALAAVFVVYRNVSEWQDGVWLAAPYACIAIALAVDAQLSEAGTRRSWRAVPLLDVPVIAGLELLFVRFAPNPSALINFNSATLLLCVLGVALSLSLRLTVLTAVEAAAVHVALQVHTDSPLRHLAVTGVLFLLGAALGVVFSVAQTRLLKDSELQKAARRQTQDRLHESEDGFLNLLDRLPDAVLGCQDGLVVFANQRAAVLFGFDDVSELHGLNPDDWTHPEDVDIASKLPRASFASVHPRDIRVRKRDGTELPVEVRTAWRLMNGYPTAIAVYRDLSERRRSQAQLIAADRLAAMGALAAGVGHEMNNPLNALALNVDLAEEQVAELAQAGVDVGEADEALRDARLAIDHLKTIVRDLGTFSRADEARVEPVDIRSVIDSTLRLAAADLRHRARIDKRFQEVSFVAANPARLGQVFLNLIVNALQAMPEGRTEDNQIVISVYQAEYQVVAEVHDNGPGVPPEQLERIFEPFYTTKPPGEGTGLGLAVSLRLVQSFGGELRCESTFGKGTTFSVTLPATVARPSHRPRVEPSGPFPIIR
ncbi:MAG: PAS domain S-box protein [Myxococcales bacterium]|nr:PAS domain S-box protein [Myxococcales bacterium]MCB9581505.1 PAS domain S-box protein [Polyangiaceae bacterium]